MAHAHAGKKRFSRRSHVSRCNVFWTGEAIEEGEQWFGKKGTLYMSNMDVVSVRQASLIR
jgi:hypothetical protein